LFFLIAYCLALLWIKAWIKAWMNRGKVQIRAEKRAGMQKKLTLRFWGEAEVRVAGMLLLTPLSKKGILLLAILATEQGRRITRTRLASLLWPDSLEETALSNLRRILTALRMTLGEARDCIIAPTPRTLALSTEGVDADIWEVIPAGSVGKRVFLEGMHDEWVLEERTRLEAQQPHQTERLVFIQTPASRLIGRETMVEEIIKNLVPNVIFTIVGPGGVGKTSVATEVAKAMRPQFPDGVFWVDLAALPHQSPVAPTVLGAIGRKMEEGKTVDETLLHALANQQALLIIDNAEHVIGNTAQLLKQLRESCPSLCLLVTSRQPLQTRHEHLYRLASLTPEQSETLFLLRAKQAGVQINGESEQAAIARLCQRLDGLPLAIELVAARTLLFLPSQIETMLSTPSSRLFVNQERDAPSRHQSLWNTLAWSWELLEKSEKDVLVGLSVFLGDWDVAAAHAVAFPKQAPEAQTEAEAVQVLSQLTAHSLVSAQDGRFRLLETVRAFVREVSEPARQDAALLRLLSWGVAIADRWMIPSHIRMDGIEKEWNHLVAALDMATKPAYLAKPEHVATAFQLLYQLNSYLFIRSDARQGLEWYRLLMPLAHDHPYRAYALRHMAILAKTVGNDTESKTLLEAALALLDTASETLKNITLRGLIYIEQGKVAQSIGDHAAAKHWFQQSLTFCQKHNDTEGLIGALMLLGGQAQREGDLVLASQYVAKSMALCRQENDTLGLIEALAHLSDIYIALRQLPQAAAQYEEALILNREQRNQVVFLRLLGGISKLLLLSKREEEAVYCFGALQKMLDKNFDAQIQNRLFDMQQQVTLPVKCFENSWNAGQSAAEPALYEFLRETLAAATQ
jgi:predicted ATPase